MRYGSIPDYPMWEKKKEAILPFSDKEVNKGQYLQFTSWARRDLEHWTIEKVTIYINNTILKDMLPAEINKLDIVYLVTSNIVSCWMKECGFHYAPLKKTLTKLQQTILRMSKQIGRSIASRCCKRNWRSLLGSSFFGYACENDKSNPKSL